VPEVAFQRLEEARAALAALRPLPPATVRELNHAFDVQLSYSSNAIEGNTLTLSETAIVIEKGITVRGKPLRDHNEALDHFSAVQFMRTLVSDPRAIGEMEIRQLHQLTVGRTLQSAGQYAARSRFVATEGGLHKFPEPGDIPQRMADLAAFLARIDPTAQCAFEVHLELVAIHPFEDGNGRTARLVMNALLLRGGYLPLLIGPEQRADYTDAIAHHQASNDAAPFNEFAAQLLTGQIETYLETVGSA